LIATADDLFAPESPGSQLVDIDENAQTDYFPEHQNLALSLPQDKLTEIGARIMEEYREDCRSRSDWLGKVARWRKLYYQTDAPTNPPWPGSSSESIPLLTEAVNQFRARGSRVMFPSQDVVDVRPTAHVTREDLDRAERVSKHMSWQITVQDEKYKKNMKQLLQMVALEGSFFRKIYRNPTLGRNVVRNVPARFLVVPYGDGPRDVEELTRKTEIVPIPRNETRKMAKRHYLIKPAELWTRSGDDDEVRDANDEAIGLEDSSNAEVSGMSRLLEWHGFLDLDGDEIEEPYICVIDAQTEEVLRVAQRWAKDDDKDKKPLEFYEHYYFLENADGFYGLGMGFLLEKINTAMNRMLRQSIDAATLKNTVGGFVDEMLGFQKGEIQFTMGQFKKVSGNGRDLREGILPMNQYFSGADQGLVSLMTMLGDHGKRLAMTTDALTGQVDKVMQPTTILALIEQGLQQFTAAQENILDSWTGELRKLYRLNQVYLDEAEYFAVLDERGIPNQHSVFLSDYASDMQVVPNADPTMATQQQAIAKAQSSMQALQAGMALGLPYTQAQIIEHFRQYYKSFGISSLDRLLPVPEQPLSRDDNPGNENVYALMENAEIPAVHWDQDHPGHLESHLAFMADPEYGILLTPEKQAQMQAHVRNHAALAYAQSPDSGADINKIMEDDPYLPEKMQETVVQTKPQMDLSGLAALAGQDSPLQ